MSRPKADTEAGLIANEKWRQTMLAKYGGEQELTRAMAARGRLGGISSKSGGFASNVVGADGLSGRQRARVVGALGGKISRRGCQPDVYADMEQHREEIQALVENGVPMTRVANSFGYRYSTFRAWVKKELY